MAVSDTKITDWSADYGGADNNSPVGSENVLTNLDDQFRNIKSVVRAESLLKQWESPKFTGLVRLSGTQFKVAGDQTSIFELNRKVRGIHGASSDYTGYVTARSFASGETTVTVAADVLFGSLQADLTQIQVGAITSGGLGNAGYGSAIPPTYLSALSNILFTAQVTNVGNAFSATFSHAIDAYRTGQVLYVKFNTANTGAATINVNGLGAKPIKRPRNSGFGPTLQDLLSGDLGGGCIHMLIYDGTVFQLVSGSGLEVTAQELTSLFTLDTSEFDAATCVSGGFFHVMGAFVVQWTKTKVINNGTFSTITLPKTSGVAELVVLAGTWADDITQKNPPILHAASATTVKVINPSGGSDTNVPGAVWVVAIGRLV